MEKLTEAGAAQNDCTAVARVRWVPEREKRVEFRDLFVGFRGSPPLGEDSIHEVPPSRTKKDCKVNGEPHYRLGCLCAAC